MNSEALKRAREGGYGPNETRKAEDAMANDAKQREELRKPMAFPNPDGPYRIEKSGDQSLGFDGYVVTGPGFVDDGNDFDNPSARMVRNARNFGYLHGLAAGRKEFAPHLSALLDIIHDDLTHAEQNHHAASINSAVAAIVTSYRKGKA